MIFGASLGNLILLLPHGPASAFGCYANKVTTKLKKMPMTYFQPFISGRLSCADVYWTAMRLVYSIFWLPVILWNNNIFLQCITVIWIFLPCCCKNVLVDVVTCQNIQWDKKCVGRTGFFSGVAHASTVYAILYADQYLMTHYIARRRGFPIQIEVPLSRDLWGKNMTFLHKREASFSHLGCSRSFVLSR